MAGAEGARDHGQGEQRDDCGCDGPGGESERPAVADAVAVAAAV
jgi:hypothetical protein